MARAFDRRAALRPRTNALRVVDDAGDGFEDLIVEDFAGRWLAQTRAAQFPQWLREISGPRSLYWKRLAQEKSAPVWVSGEELESPFVMEENEMRFEIDFGAGYSQGIFLDQRDNRERVLHTSRGASVLNCFAYTCAFGVAAARGGAKTVNIDLSKNYLAWGKRNYELNKVALSGHEFLFGDVFDWLKRFKKKARLFDLVILDPPTFSRAASGSFRVEKDFGALVRAAVEVLAPRGRIFCSTNQRSLTLARFREIIIGELPSPAAWKLDLRPMPPDFTGDAYLKSSWVTR
ncbi:MAG: class I SAM-dependent methyltransferase [Verrucomicrobiota bacterium]|nr:class I SAM-dependent methyltransferase [Verrucomicrobiota bacterium]